MFTNTTSQNDAKTIFRNVLIPVDDLSSRGGALKPAALLKTRDRK